MQYVKSICVKYAVMQKSRLAILVCSNANNMVKFAVMHKQNRQACNYAETPLVGPSVYQAPSRDMSLVTMLIAYCIFKPSYIA